MKLPNRLSYQGSIDPSIITFHAIWPSGEIKPLRLHSRVVLGNKGNAEEGFNKDGSRKENVTRANLAEGNPHEIDYCHIPHGVKETIGEFSVTIEANAGSSKCCNDREVTNMLERLTQLYSEKIGFEYLAERYLKNIIKGTWLWRNQKTYSTTITISPWKLTPITAEDIQRKRFEEGWENDLLGWKLLVQAFTDALQDPKKYFILEIKAVLSLPTNAQFHPSQVFKESKKGTKGRTYQTTEIDDDESPIFGAYKTGAAIAMIDDWYPDAEYPLRVSSYGVDKKHSIAHRHPDTELDIYSLLMRSEELIEQLENNTFTQNGGTNQLHFIIANLIKGGLFQLGGR
ncbi:type I-F CRISPR-associated protein Csy3 [Photobacterium sagamiensis]|uniref:type I-F CRISPR-associated protein Csy3 n=1 Tax=Photobacterium sagamiensis TaxID=2910241 RepID=UPI003D10E8A2